jgi:DNA polymerase I-like protein with 3'-5' exonuclease and polymerase domains
MNILDKSGGKVVISKEESEEFLGTKFALYPEIKGSFHRYVEKCARDTGYLYNLLGHPLAVTEHDITPSILKELYAIIPQSTVGEITNMAYVKMYNYIVDNKLKWDLLANTHDSYLCQCPIGEEVECARVMQEFINITMVSPIDGVEFSMKSEAVAGYNWAGFKKEFNEKGLKGI